MAVFCGGAPLLHTVYFYHIPLSHCWFPPTAIVNLEVDIRMLSFDVMGIRVLESMPNLEVLTIRGSILWMSQSGDDAVVLPLLKQFTCGAVSIGSIFKHAVMPTLRYLCLGRDTKGDWDNDNDFEDSIQFFPNAITHCTRTPMFPNVDELHYEVDTDYAASCIFVGLPKVSLVRFPKHFEEGGLELCKAFFKALIDDKLRWPFLKTLIFNGLPGEIFDSLRDFVLARSSDEYKFTIRIHKPDHNTRHDIIYRNLNAERMEWLEKHVDLERPVDPGPYSNRT
jgi:hypothetical protein